MKKRKKAEVKDQTRPGQGRQAHRSTDAAWQGPGAPWRHAACFLPAPRGARLRTLQCWHPGRHRYQHHPGACRLPTAACRLPLAAGKLQRPHGTAAAAAAAAAAEKNSTPPRRPAALAVCFLLRGSKPRQCRHTGTKARRQVGLQRPHPAQGQTGDFRRAPGAGPAAGAAPRAQTGDQASVQASAAARIIAPCPLLKFCSASMPWACA